MKIFLLLLCVIGLFGCHKSNSSSPSYSYAQLLDSMGISDSRICYWKLNNVLDSVTFNSDQTITENWKGKVYHYPFNYSVSYPIFKLLPKSDTVTSDIPFHSGIQDTIVYDPRNPKSDIAITLLIHGWYIHFDH